MTNVVLLCLECKGKTTFANCTAREAHGQTAHCSKCGRLVHMQVQDSGKLVGLEAVNA